MRQGRLIRPRRLHRGSICVACRVAAPRHAQLSLSRSSRRRLPARRSAGLTPGTCGVRASRTGRRSSETPSRGCSARRSAPPCSWRCSCAPACSCSPRAKPSATAPPPPEPSTARWNASVRPSSETDRQLAELQPSSAELQPSLAELRPSSAELGLSSARRSPPRASVHGSGPGSGQGSGPGSGPGPLLPTCLPALRRREAQQLGLLGRSLLGLLLLLGRGQQAAHTQGQLQPLRATEVAGLAGARRELGGS